MGPTDEARARIDALARTLAPGAPPGATLRASLPDPAAVPGTTLPRLDTLTVTEGATGRAEIELTALLGRGGMGAVWLARQRSLDREVAVKRLVGTEWSAREAAALLVEARATGALEHPGIVPVHALGIGEGGAPMLVMKRIDGTTLAALVERPDHPAWPALERRYGERTVAYVEILSRVADALELAHARGWLHRDVKPENVMIGAFGETYLLDWGVACRLAQPRDGSIVGTPAFMAPEMLDERAPLDARTDVYLLGATLHTVLTGQPLHAGSTLQAVMLSAALSEPHAYDDTVEPELAALAQRATARDPAERPASAAAFRDALAAFLRHRGAQRLTRRVIDQLDALGAPTGEALVSPETTRTLTEARFGLAHALREWPESELAQRALQRVLVLSVQAELARGSVESAAALLSELPAPEPELAARVEASREEASRQKRLAEHARADALARDPRVHGRSRALFFSVLALGSVVISGGYMLFAGEQERLALSVVSDLVQLAVLLAFTFALRARLLANRFGRTLMSTIVATAVVVTVASATIQIRGGSVADMMVERNLVFAAVFAVASFETTRLLWGAFVWALAAALLISWHAPLAGPLTMCTILLGIGAILWTSMARRG